MKIKPLKVVNSRTGKSKTVGVKPKANGKKSKRWA